MRKSVCFITLLSIIAVLSGDALARSFERVEARTTNPTALSPAYCNAQHNVGNISLGISNDGTFGLGWSLGGLVDCFTGQPLMSCEFPKGSQTTYLWAGDLWIGAIVGTDTLVSTSGMGGHEFHPDNPPLGEMQYRSTIDPTRPEYAGAVSEQDYIAVYADTCTNCTGLRNDELDGRWHRPLNIEVTQRSHAWSYPHTEDFILIDYEVRNIGAERLQQVYMGVYIDADVHSLANNYDGYEDDLTGFRELVPALYLQPPCPPDSDVVNLAWTVDNDGGLALPNVFPPTPHVAATRLLGTLPQQSVLSYNWWIRWPNGYCPQARATYRDLVITEGEPLGDRNKYHFLSNGEIDFDQPRVATIGGLDPIWLPPPPEIAGRYATGSDARYLLSFGPFDIDPGQSLPIALAYVAGEDFHTNGDNFFNLPDNPDAWYEGVDFSDLSMNAIWADWVYDNPGVDTDSDGYAGEFQLCDGDTVWRTGDGIPDWRATSPPTAPTFWVEPLPRALWVRWNGFGSETTIDWFSRRQEFEGYKAYLSTSGNPGSFSCLGSYDIEDYRRYFWDAASFVWRLAPERLTIEEALCSYAPNGCDDPSWHPMDYSRQAPFVMPGHPDSMFYFDPILANASRFGLETPFVKRFPAAPRPEYSSPDEVPVDSVDVYLTDDGYFKYYEYEFLIEDLLPEQPYWITVTAFDCVSLLPGLVPEESGIAPQAKMAVPLPDLLCCTGMVGNANCDVYEIVNIADVVVMIDYLYINRLPLCCPAEADVNQSGGNDAQLEDITIGDIAILIDYLFITGTSLGLPDCL